MIITIDRLDFNDLLGLKNLYEDAFDGSLTDYEKMIDSFNQIKESVKDRQTELFGVKSSKKI